MASPAPLHVRQVTTRAEYKIFVEFPWTLYRHDPHWVPPLLSWRRAKLDPRKNPTWDHLEGDYFIAWRGDQPVGTIAAFINHRHNDFHGERIGFFGLFELYNDQAVANALLDIAAESVRARGAISLRGPATFSTNDEVGVLVEGFDSLPVMDMTYNPPYYPRLLENAPGFEPIMRLFSYRLSLETWAASQKFNKLLRVTQRNNERRRITVRTFSRRHIRRDLAILKDIYNHIWDNNWGFVPMTDAELDDMAKLLRRNLYPKLALIAEVDGQPVGFVQAFPDLNQALQYARPRPGKPELVSRAQTLWHWRLRPKIDRVCIPLMGIHCDYRGIGVEAALFIRLYEEAIRFSTRHGWQYADAGWVLEANVPMQRLIESYSGAPYKRFAIYGRALDPAGVVPANVSRPAKPQIPPTRAQVIARRVTQRPRQVVRALPHPPRRIRRKLRFNPIIRVRDLPFLHPRSRDH